jgi:serine O-acetyltransferase
MSSITKVLREDFESYRRGPITGAANACVTIFNNPGLQAVLVYRFGRFLFLRRRYVWWWPLLILGAPVYALGALFVRQCFGIRLLMSARIGSGFSVAHFGGVEIQNCRLGERCAVAQQTKVGSPDSTPGPQIGNGVWIGAHAKILAPVTVGDGATIAPGARVIRNVPKQSLAVGDPARIVSRSYDNRRLLPEVIPASMPYRR